MAVYTRVEPDELEAFLEHYDLGEVTAFKGIAEGVENSNYFVQTNGDSFILTLYERRVRLDDLPFFLGLMDHLAEAGFPCPTPIHGRDGKVLRTLCGRPAALVGFLKGVSPFRPTVGHCAEVGAGLAWLHEAAGGFALERPNDLSLDGWRRLVEDTAERADEVRPGLGAEIADELEALSAAWPSDLPRGVIHADLFPDNVFFIGGKLSGVIDFYFACTDALAYDIAICLNAWCFERDNSLNVTKARALITAYRRRRPLSEAELAALPIFARGSALRFLLTRLYDWLNQADGALVRPKDPIEYLQKLRFHRGIAGIQAYGIYE